MNDQEILTIFQDALRSVAPGIKTQLAMDHSLTALGIDSMTALSLAGEIEGRLSIRFPDNDLAQVQSVKDLVQLVRAANAAPQEPGT